MSGFVLTIGGEKGGPGKSTIATNFAAILADMGVECCLVNTDRQETASFWASLRSIQHDQLPQVLTVTKRGQTINNDIKALADKFQVVIVDAAGQDSVEQCAAMTVTDLLLVPIRATQFDVWTLAHLANLVDKVRTINPAMEACLFGNQVPAVSRDRDRATLTEVCADFPQFRLLNTIVVTRVAFQHAASQGLAVTELPRVDVKARTEIMQLFEETFRNGESKFVWKTAGRRAA